MCARFLFFIAKLLLQVFANAMRRRKLKRRSDDNFISASRSKTMSTTNSSNAVVIRLLSYNVFLRPPGIHSSTSDYKDRRLGLLAPAVFPNFDVCCFQECFSFLTSRQDRVLHISEGYGFKSSAVAPRRCGWTLRIDGGLAMTSRFVVSDTQFAPFDRGTASDWFPAKGVLYTRLKLSQTRSLHLFSTHTQASYDTFPSVREDPYAQIRLRQIYRIRAFIDHCLEAAQQDDPIVVCGDFNVDAIPKDNFIGSSNEYQCMINILSGTGINEEFVNTKLAIDGKKPKLNQHGKLLSSRIKYDVKDVVFDFLNARVDEDQRKHPVTFPADGDVKKERLDYIFLLQRADSSSNSADLVSPKKVGIKTAGVCPFNVTREPFKHLSGNSVYPCLD